MGTRWLSGYERSYVPEQRIRPLAGVILLGRGGHCPPLLTPYCQSVRLLIVCWIFVASEHFVVVAKILSHL